MLDASMNLKQEAMSDFTLSQRTKFTEVLIESSRLN